MIDYDRDAIIEDRNSTKSDRLENEVFVMNSCLRTLSALLIMGTLLVACSANSSPPATSSVTVENVQEEGQTLTIINPESMDSSIQAEPQTGEKKYQIQTRLTDFHLLSSTTGLAWGATRNELRLYRTEDNGVTWSNISPSTSMLFPNNPDYGKDIFFLNKDSGWVIRNTISSGEAIILRTNDGGMTWKMASLPDNARVSAVFFLDAEQGWIVTEGDYRASSEAKAVYSTKDSGATWNKIMSTPILSADASARLHKLPRTGIISGMSFTDKKHGFVTVIEAGQPSLYETKSGGVSWNKVDGWFDTQKFPSCTRFSIDAPEFFRGNTQYGWVPFGCVKEDSIKYQGYFTEDGGASWSFVPLAVPWLQGDSAALSTTFLNRREGWSLYGSLVYHTTDLGATWSLLPQSTKLTEIVLEYPKILKVQFFNSQFGWLLVGQSDNNRSLLMQTMDGGETWQVL